MSTTPTKVISFPMNPTSSAVLFPCSTSTMSSSCYSTTTPAMVVQSGNLISSSPMRSKVASTWSQRWIASFQIFFLCMVDFLRIWKLLSFCLNYFKLYMTHWVYSKYQISQIYGKLFVVCILLLSSLIIISSQPHEKQKTCCIGTMSNYWKVFESLLYNFCFNH